ncbi:cold-shock protein [Anopheles sinensis]|uniref:Cold-shock protein n=1 Tax=Anopheles sinensis TaxID=74873 RepID=A0A084V9W5_ANOSI|nr:cold-shock protein [Anopheles sinensis]
MESMRSGNETRYKHLTHAPATKDSRGKKKNNTTARSAARVFPSESGSAERTGSYGSSRRKSFHNTVACMSFRAGTFSTVCV